MKNKLIICLVGLLLLAAPMCARAQYASFAVVTDTHVGAPGTAYPAFIRNIEKEGLHTIIHTGDAIDSPGNLSQWAQFFDITGPGKTLRLAPGNHDISGLIDQSAIKLFSYSDSKSFLRLLLAFSPVKFLL